MRFDVGTKLATDYVIVHKDGFPEPKGPADPIGSGGASVVFRCEYRDLPHRAVKVLAPSRELLDRVGWDRFEETFTREIRMLTRITHTRIAKILDYGVYEADGTRRLYYAMDYIDGKPFDQALADLDLDGRELHALLEQVLDALVYLHGRSVMHCDLKEENVLVAIEDGRASLTVVNLGVAKTIKVSAQPADADAQGSLDEEDTTTFFSSPKLMMPAFKDRLGRPLTRAELREMFPSHDLYCFGRLVGMVLASRESELGSYLGPSGLRALRALHKQLEGDPQSFESAAGVLRSWRKLAPGWLAPLNVGELAVGGGGETSVPTPNGRVGLSERIRRVVNHQLVQRLRMVPQLEFLSIVLPGATHSRLLHSLSTFDVARLYLGHMVRDPAFRLMVEPRDIEAALLWALLHDVGHFPLSHMFEDFAHEQRHRDGDAPRTIPTDDDLFWSFVDPSSVTGDFRRYPEIIREVAAERGGDLGEGLFAFAAEDGRFGTDVLAAMHQIATRAEPVHCVLAGILSSPIDVDKVAYLQDDSLMSGVRFGGGLDLDGLLNSLRAPHPDQIKPGEPVIAIADRGFAAAEGVVLARYWMLRRVYWDQENRAMMAMAKFVIQQLLDGEVISMEDYYRENVTATQEHALRWLSERFQAAVEEGRVSASVNGGPERELRNPLPGLRDGRREIYQRIITISNDHVDDEQRLYGLIAFKDRERVSKLMERMHQVLDDALDRVVERGEVLLDVPLRERDRLDVPVWVYSGRRPDRPTQLAESPVIGSLQSEFDQHVKKCRVFLHPDIAAELGPRLDEVRRELLATLRASCGL